VHLNILLRSVEPFQNEGEWFTPRNDQLTEGHVVVHHGTLYSTVPLLAPSIAGRVTNEYKEGTMLVYAMEGKE
jgi:hypothetical protein